MSTTDNKKNERIEISERNNQKNIEQRSQYQVDRFSGKINPETNITLTKIETGGIKPKDTKG